MVHMPKSCAMAGIGIEGEKATPGVSSPDVLSQLGSSQFPGVDSL